MHKYLLAACLAAFSMQAMASCDKLKEEIDAKLQAKGIKSYTLEIVPVAPAASAAPAAAAAASSAAATSAAAKPAAAAAPGKVVGNCDGGTKQIIYHRG
jgi:hypothetical protein